MFGFGYGIHVGVSDNHIKVISMTQVIDLVNGYNEEVQKINMNDIEGVNGLVLKLVEIQIQVKSLKVATEMMLDDVVTNNNSITSGG